MEAGLTEVFSGAGALATIVGAAAAKAASKVVKTIEERILMLKWKMQRS